ncbi:MAG: MFS transporter, partial [Rhizobiaceae bacterium]
MRLPFIPDSPRAAILAVFAGFGAAIGSFAGSTPQMVAQAGLTNSTWGMAVTVLAIASVTAMSAGGLLARHFTHRRLLLTLLPLLTAALYAVLTIGTLAGFFAAIAAFGLVTGALDVIMNAEGGAIEGDLKRPVYTMFHASVSLSIAVFALVSSYLSTRYGTPWTAAVASLALLAAFVAVHRSVRDRPLPERKGGRVFIARPTRPLVLMGLATGLVIACEITALFWSSKLLAETAPALATISGLGAAFFGLANGLVRLPGDRLRARYGEIRLMLVLISVAIVGFAGLGLADGFAANVIFFGMTGMGLSILCPCLFAMAGAETPHNRAAGLSVALMIAGIPRIVAPSLFGLAADAVSTGFAFGLCAVVL